MTASTTEGPLILVVEDDETQARLAERALRKHGFRVERVATGAEALAALQQGESLLGDGQGTLALEATEPANEPVAEVELPTAEAAEVAEPAVAETAPETAAPEAQPEPLSPPAPAEAAEPAAPAADASASEPGAASAVPPAEPAAPTPTDEPA